MAIRPLDDKMLVKICDSEEKTAGGIVLPDSAREKPQVGEVLSVGIGPLLASGKRGEMAVKKGDKIYFGKYSGSDIKIDGVEHKILKEADVLARVEK